MKKPLEALPVNKNLGDFQINGRHANRRTHRHTIVSASDTGSNGQLGGLRGV